MLDASLVRKRVNLWTHHLITVDRMFWHAGGPRDRGPPGRPHEWRGIWDGQPEFAEYRGRLGLGIGIGRDLNSKTRGPISLYRGRDQGGSHRRGYQRVGEGRGSAPAPCPVTRPRGANLGFAPRFAGDLA